MGDREIGKLYDLNLGEMSVVLSSLAVDVTINMMVEEGKPFRDDLVRLWINGAIDQRLGQYRDYWVRDELLIEE